MSFKQRVLAGCAALALGLGAAGAAMAQNLVITNAHIIDGTGKVIERGEVTVKDGRIVSVSSGEAPKGAAGTPSPVMKIVVKVAV